MDAREIERCIDEFGTDIYRFCLKLCMDKSEAEDLYQQTFLKALETEWTLDWGQNPKALFFSLTYNLGRAIDESSFVEIRSPHVVIWRMEQKQSYILKKVLKKAICRKS